MANNVDLATLTAKLALDAKQFNAGIDTATQKIGTITKDNAWSKVGESLNSLAKGATIAGSAIVGASGIAVKSAIDFESAFTGVKKTVDFKGTESEAEAFFASLSDGILEMSKRMPVAATEIAGVMEAAGQLGIQNDQLLSFTEVMIGLGAATNLSAQEAAVALSQFANVTQMSQNDFDRLGSSIVALGNNMATDERQITDFASELAVLKTAAGFSEADILGLGAAMASMGLESAASGTAMQRLTQDIVKAVYSGGDALETFAATSGMTSEQFATAWKEDATGAFLAFITGLGSKSTADQLAIFDELDIKQMREIDMLQRLAGNAALVTQAVQLSNTAWEDNAALTEEVSKRNESTESQLQMLKNQLTEIAIQAGNALLPVVRQLLEQAQPLLDKVSTYLKEHPDTVVRIAETGAKLLVIGTAVSGIIKVVTAIGSFISTIKTLGTAIAVLTGGGAAGAGGIFGGLMAGLAAIGPAVLAVGAVVGVFTVGWNNNWLGCRDTFNQVYEETGSKSEALKAVIRSVADQIGDKVKELGANIANWWTGTAAPWFDNIGDSIRTWFENVKTSVSEWFSNTISSVSQCLSNIKNNVTQWGSNLWSSISNWLSNARSSISNWINSVVDWGKNTASTFWDGVKNGFTSAVSWLTTTFNDMKNKLVTWFTNVISNITETLTKIKNAVTESMTKIMSTVSEKLTNILNDVKTKITEIWNSVNNKFTEIKNGVTNFFQNIFTTTTTKMGEIKTNVVNTVTNTWTSVTGKLQDFVGSVQNVFSQVKNIISNKMQEGLSAVSSVVDRMREKIRGVLDSISDAWDSVKNFASNAWDNVTSTVGGWFGGYYADGGSISAGKAYIVGERGPELFVPNSNGYIVDNKDTISYLSGDGEINIYIQGDVYDDQYSMTRKLKGAILEVIREQVAYG